jgi:spermidine synthase
MNSVKQTDREVFISIFLIGILCLMIELIQVRMLSFFLGSISNFLAIPIALFGLALGSLYCHFYHKGDKHQLIQWTSILVFPVLSLTFVLFFIIANSFFPNVHVMSSMPGKDAARLIVYATLFLPTYMLFGILLSTYFSIYSHMIGRLYFFDLTGAGLGCLITSVMFTYADLPPVILGLLLLALLLMLVTRFPNKAIITTIAILFFGVLQILAFSGVIFKEHPNAVLLARTLMGRSADTGVAEVATRWNHISRSALYRTHANTANPANGYFVIVQDDGLSNVGVIKYDPNITSEDLKKRLLHHALPFNIGRKPKSALVVFAGSGKDMIHIDGLSDGKAQITGVELNPAVKELALDPGAYTTNLPNFFDKPNIHYVIREGRDFLNNDTGKYDLIFVASNGAVHANRTGHTRKYLDTYEAMAAYLDHLTPDGMIFFSNQPIERKIESLRTLFEERNLGDFSKCLYVFGLRGSRTLQTALVQTKPFTRKEADTIRKERLQKHGGPRWETVYNPFGGGRQYFEKYVKEPVSARNDNLVTDDRPFTRKVKFEGFSLFPGKQKLSDLFYASDWIKIFTVLLFSVVSLLVILVMRFKGKKEGRLPFLWLLYLFVTGVSYMGVQIGLIGKVELFVGNPLYAVAVILASFLISNAVGAFLQDKYGIMRGPKTIVIISALTIAWGVLVVDLLNIYLLSIPMVIKVLAVTVAVAPSGTALGMFYPFGVASLVKSGREETVPITYGAATLSSVLGSSLAVTLLTNFGFSAIIIAGGVGYASVSIVYLAAKKYALKKA